MGNHSLAGQSHIAHLVMSIDTKPICAGLKPLKCKYQIAVINGKWYDTGEHVTCRSNCSMPWQILPTSHRPCVQVK